MLIDDKNFLNIVDSKRDCKIYRYIPFQRLLEIFDTNNLTLTKPSEWEDPFENIILKYYESKRQKKEFDLQYRNCVYAQCWSYSSGSDALWRIYSVDKKGVWIRTTVNKLFEELYINNRIRNTTCFIGNVKYINSSEIISRLDIYAINIKKSKNNCSIAKSLLFKRKAFNHEREVRLVYIDVSCNRNKKIHLTSNPLLYIEKIMFDPRIDDKEFIKNRKLIREKYGFIGQISKSTLYKLPNKLTEL